MKYNLQWIIKHIFHPNFEVMLYNDLGATQFDKKSAWLGERHGWHSTKHLAKVEPSGKLTIPQWPVVWWSQNLVCLYRICVNNCTKVFGIALLGSAVITKTSFWLQNLNVKFCKQRKLINICINFLPFQSIVTIMDIFVTNDTGPWQCHAQVISTVPGRGRL